MNQILSSSENNKNNAVNKNIRKKIHPNFFKFQFIFCLVLCILVSKQKQFLHIFVWREGRNMRKRLAKCRISRYDKIRKECPKGRKGGMAA